LRWTNSLLCLLCGGEEHKLAFALYSIRDKFSSRRRRTGRTLVEGEDLFSFPSIDIDGAFRAVVRAWT
jgi:hypothetical protein